MKVSKKIKMDPLADGRAVHNWLKAMIVLAFPIAHISGTLHNYTLNKKISTC